MHAGVECVGEHDTLESAARRMRDLNIGALPIRGDDDRPHGMLTDRNIVVQCIAEGRNPATMTAGELAHGTPWTVEAQTDNRHALTAMEEHQVRRLPVMDNQRPIGMISETDLAQNLPDYTVGHFVHAISAHA